MKSFFCPISQLARTCNLRAGRERTDDTSYNSAGRGRATHGRLDQAPSMTNSTLQDQWTDPLFPLSSGDAVGTVCAFLTVMAASVGGIGGGGLLVPLYMLALGLGRFAIPLSKATICGGAISNVAIQCRRRHPLAEDRPLIAYNVAAILIVH